MDSEVKLYLERSENELRLARIIFKMSGNEKIKLDLGANPNDTFYSAVISHSYYCIFYCAKAFLLSKKIKTRVPDEHKKTYLKFKSFVDSGVIDVVLSNIYDLEIVKAADLLKLFSDERWKRGHFSYKTLAQANKSPASDSIENAIKFLSSLKLVLENEK